MPIAKRLCISLFFLNLSIAEAATPANTAWQTLSSSNGSVAQPRHESGAVVVDGKLYLLGGRGMRSVQMFDPASALWTDLGPMPMELHHFQPVSIGDLIYVIGAHTCCYPTEVSVADIHVFNTNTQTWSINGSLPASRVRGSTAAVVRDNIIYLLGGNTQGHSGGAVAWFDSYNPVTGVWTELPDAPSKRDHFSGVIVSDYLVAAAGRQTAQPNPFKNAVAATDMYDFISEQWVAAEAIPTLRAGALAATAGDEIIVAGGEINTTSVALATVEAMNVYTRQWRNDKFHVIAGSLSTGGAPETSVHETLQLDLTASLDHDADGLSNIDERQLHGTNPGSADTDSDSLDDNHELIQYASNPLSDDTDGDGINDGAEVTEWNTDPTKPDTDADGLKDFEEAFTFNTNPTKTDTDADNLSDKEEVLDYLTNPLAKDTDADGIDDGDEVNAGTDPLVADSDDGITVGGSTQGSDTGNSGSVTQGSQSATDGDTEGAGLGTLGGSSGDATDGQSSDGATGPGLTTVDVTDGSGAADNANPAQGSVSSGGSVSVLLLFIMLVVAAARAGTINRQIHDEFTIS